ncbi:hypothetical protein BDV37DRAFT_169000 [Aspergillus pseudonomiae]|uniref:Uncharacterized protein n=1 Tax=Aspergillus pseudonomiae TaxID=1506151 RepID=A0A5N7D672_9EURO|nr:uncharacterized protein BDV37DRAFT_169000 [Aspergillus pseudonomiae]KAE8401896.1 hypothetical protein BDV37DRAFT_169000 [Aspergillus pseudonomiae]
MSMSLIIINYSPAKSPLTTCTAHIHFVPSHPACLRRAYHIASATHACTVTEDILDRVARLVCGRCLPTTIVFPSHRKIHADYTLVDARQFQGNNKIKEMQVYDAKQKVPWMTPGSYVVSSKFHSYLYETNRLNARKNEPGWNHRARHGSVLRRNDTTGRSRDPSLP